MRGLSLTWVVALAGLALAAPGAKDPPEGAPPGLVGRWAVESTTLNGNPLPASADLVVTYTADGKFEGRSGGKVVHGGTFTSDPKKDPAEIDLAGAGPPGVPWPGIYKVDGDTLTVCLRVDQKRPATFDPAAGTIRTVYKRIKAD